MALDVWKEHIRLRLTPRVTPVVHPPRKVPFTQRETVKEELDRMEELGVIRKADGPTQCVSSLVVVQKPNGKVLVCLDPRDSFNSQANRSILNRATVWRNNTNITNLASRQWDNRKENSFFKECCPRLCRRVSLSSLFDIQHALVG